MVRTLEEEKGDIVDEQNKEKVELNRLRKDLASRMEEMREYASACSKL